MTFIRKQAGLLRSARRWAAWGLMLALLVRLSTLAGGGFTGGATSLALQVPVPEAIAQTTTRTINLNTGFDQWAATPALISVGGVDNEWRVITDPTSTPPEPPGNGVSTGRPADVVSDAVWVSFNSSLPGSFLNSRWISLAPNAGLGSSIVASYKYAFYFTLPPGFSSPQLTMKLSADDHITNVTLNGCVLFTGSGGIFTNPPLPISSSLLSCFNSGPNVNVLTVTVENTVAGTITGLIVDGTVTYKDCDRRPIQQIPGLASITFWESTVATPGPPTPFTFAFNSSQLLTQLVGPLGPSNNDFEGVAGAEFYDVFYSNWDGSFNATGEFVTIEAVFPNGAPSGGGLNIARVDFVGTGQYANSVASFVALGNNAMPNDVGFAVDGNLLTDTTMGNTGPPPPPQRLRVTVGFPCPCVQPPPGMVAWWPLDEPNGVGIVNDIAPSPSSTANNQGTPKPGGLVGSPNGPDAVTGVNGTLNGAMYFAGPYLEVQSQADVNFGVGDFTIDAWIKPVSLVDANFLSLIVHKIDGGGVGYALYTLGNGAGGRTLKLVLNGSTYTSNPDITSTSWYHVAVTVKRSSTTPTGTFYINGQQSGPTFTPITANLDNNSPLLIGASFLSGLTGLPNVGRHEITIDELEIFKRELSQPEIQLIAFSSGKCKPTLACVPPPPGLAHWWPFDETAGGSTASDIVGGRNGTTKVGAIGSIGSPNSVAGNVSNAFNFDGSSAFVEVPDGPGTLSFGNPGQEFSIDAWIKVNAGDASGVRPIVDKRNEIGGRVAGYQFYLRDGKLSFQLADGVGGSNVCDVNPAAPAASTSCTNYESTANVADGQWHLVAVTVQRTGTSPQVRLYVDGASAPVFTGPTRIHANNNAALLIGKNNPTVSFAGQFFKGLIDELEIFNRVLTPQEVQGIFKAGSAGKCKPQPPGEATADLGDAPDSTNNQGNAPMTAHPNVMANFPTVFNSSPPGPKHLQPKGLAWLGPDVSCENEADQPPDCDGVTNIDPTAPAGIGTPDRDKFDDGVVLPIAIPMICGQTQFNYTVTSTVAAKLYVNVWFDFNRDGDWDDPIQKCPLGPAITGSFTEWAVQNDLITVAGPGTFTFTTPAFGAANPTKGSEMWMRITLTDQPIAPPQGADGSGPTSGYPFGETEDYLLRLTYSELCGIKFNDLNGNGQQDPGEPGLAGWVIEVKDANGNIIGYAVTDAQGRYCVVVPVPGTYTVSEQQQPGWTQTFPVNPPTHTVTVPPAHTNLNFGNQQKGGQAEICVFKFEDLDGDGVRDPNEPLLPGWQFNVTPGVGTVTTGPTGGICFGVSAPGTYTIIEQPQGGWTPTTPTTVTVPVLPGQLVNVFFGNKKKEDEKKCDLAIKKTVDPNPPVAGQPFAFAVTVTNVGNAPCPPTTTVTDNLPPGFSVTLFNPNTGAGWVCPSGPPNIVCTNATLTLQPGQSSMVFAVVGTMSPGISIENCAELKNPNDTNPNNNKDCIKVTVVGKCDLMIRKSVSPNPVQSGQPVTITLTVQNVGTGPCGPNTVVQDPPTPGLTIPSQTVAISQSGGTATWACLPLGGGVQCVTASTLLVGYTATFTFTANVTIAPPPGGVANIQNCATVNNPNDPLNPANPGNNQSCVTLQVRGVGNPVDLALAKLLDGQLRVEQEATYVLRVTNVGGAPTTGPIRVTDPLPPQLRFVSATGTGWSCSAEGQNVLCTSAGPLAPNSTSNILLRVRVAAPAGTQITNCAIVETAGDANPANNRGCHTATVQR